MTQETLNKTLCEAAVCVHCTKLGPRLHSLLCWLPQLHNHLALADQHNSTTALTWGTASTMQPQDYATALQHLALQHLALLHV